MNAVNGKLDLWVRHLRMVQKLMESDLLNVRQDLYSVETSIIELIREARKSDLKLHWCWKPEDVYQFTELDEKDKYFHLPSIDVRNLFGIKSNNGVMKFLKKHNIHQTVIEDTESGAWYPLFNTQQDAVDFITKIDIVLDKIYLKK